MGQVYHWYMCTNCIVTWYGGHLKKIILHFLSLSFSLSLSLPLPLSLPLSLSYIHLLHFTVISLQCYIIKCTLLITFELTEI